MSSGNTKQVRLVTSSMPDTWFQAQESPIYLTDVLDGSNGVAMTVGFARYGKGSSNAWTVTYDEALVITQGTFSVDTADGTTTASAGQIIYLEAGTELVYRADEDCELAFVTYPHWQQATQESEFASRLDDFHPVPASSATWPS